MVLRNRLLAFILWANSPDRSGWRGERLVGHPSDGQRLSLERLVELVTKLLRIHEVADPPAVRMAGLAL
jgi:hypothetical protein